MTRAGVFAATVVALTFSLTAASAQNKSGADKLYILNCGDGIAGDVSRWSPGVDVAKSMAMSGNCYLIHHPQGWLLWDTGIPDSIAAMPNGLAPSDPRAIHWRVTTTLASQLEMLRLKPADIKYVAVSHSHPDHVGNVEMWRCFRRPCC
jgi:N-acyl homoserine lactone hydrolase